MHATKCFPYCSITSSPKISFTNSLVSNSMSIQLAKGLAMMTVMSNIYIRVRVTSCTITIVIDSLAKRSFISLQLDANPIPTDYFIPYLEGREIRLAVERTVHMKPQIVHLNAQCTVYVKPCCTVDEPCNSHITYLHCKK
jgi:hypothetical protein